MTKYLPITSSLAYSWNRQEQRFQIMQYTQFPYYLEGNFKFTPITNFYLCPEEIVMPYNKGYILIAFDYEPVRTGMEIVRIQDRYTTTHFKQLISKN